MGVKWTVNNSVSFKSSQMNAPPHHNVSAALYTVSHQMWSVGVMHWLKCVFSLDVDIFQNELDRLIGLPLDQQFLLKWQCKNGKRSIIVNESATPFMYLYV